MKAYFCLHKINKAYKFYIKCLLQFLFLELNTRKYVLKLRRIFLNRPIKNILFEYCTRSSKKKKKKKQKKNELIKE